MKVLVTGVQGQLARALVEAAQNAHDILAVGRPELDLTDAESIARAIDHVAPDVVVNAAAYTAVDKAESDSETAFATNEHGARNIANACSERSLPIIHISTDYVFSGNKPTPYVETDATAPTGVYGHSKLAGELAVAEHCPHHLILRTAWVYSPYGNNFVKTMLRLADSRDELNVVADQVGSPTYAPHLAVAILRLIDCISTTERNGIAWGTYHAAGHNTASWHDLATETFVRARQMGLPSANVNAIPTEQYPTPAARPKNSRLDCSKLSKTFGIQLPDWKSGVADCVSTLAEANAGRASSAT